VPHARLGDDPSRDAPLPPPPPPALAGASPAAAQTTERIDTVAGSGNGGFSGDGGPAVQALLTAPSDVVSLGGGAFLIADTSNHRIRRVDAAGAISTVAGSGPATGAVGAFAGDGGAATSARLNQPRGVSPTIDGGFLIADTGNHAIRKVSAAGIVTTVAGVGGTAGYGGDGDGATGALLNSPRDVAALSDGSFLIADTGNNRIRRVSAGGIVTTVAGIGTAGSGGDGGPATSSLLNQPSSVAPLTGGGFLIADTGNNRIRRVDAGGTIANVAGTGVAGFGGDGGPATAALLNGPEGVAVRDDGSILIGDSTNERVREVNTLGVIRTLAGTGTLGFSGDGGPASLAQLSHPRGLGTTSALVWIADAFNHRIRQVGNVTTTAPASSTARPPTTQAPPGVSPPQLGRSLVAGRVSGKVRIRLPGTHRFLPLTVGNFPLGSELDTTAGVGAVFYETDESGTGASAFSSGGRYLARQAAERVEAQRPGELVLSGAMAHRCPSVHALARAAKHRGKGRKLRVRAKGKIKTRGRYGSAIVRGTGWTTRDLCRGQRSGTLFSVFEGVVSVRDFVKRKTVRLPAGRRYFAGR
jgi:hypothetical protein